MPTSWAVTTVHADHPFLSTYRTILTMSYHNRPCRTPGAAGLGIREPAAAHGGAVPLRARPLPEAGGHEARERGMCLRGRPHICR